MLALWLLVRGDPDSVLGPTADDLDVHVVHEGRQCQRKRNDARDDAGLPLLSFRGMLWSELVAAAFEVRFCRTLRPTELVGSALACRTHGSLPSLGDEQHGE